MSLINEMLRDLEKRRKPEVHSLTCSEAPVAVNETISAKLFWLVGGILLLAGIAWVGVTVIPTMRLSQPAIPPLSAPHAVVATTTAGDSIAVVVPPTVDNVVADAVSEPVVDLPDEDVQATVSGKKGAELLSFGVVESQESVRLSLTFAQLPEYRLIQNGAGTNELVIRFNQTQIGADFEVPQLSDGLLKQVSLVPQEQMLELLIDLNRPGQVQGFQLVDTSDQGHRLLIEIVAVAPVVKPQQKLVATQVVAAQPPRLVEEKVVVTEPPVTAGVSKNHKPLSRDKQAYLDGLTQLKQRDLTAAEASFNQALLVNPNMLNARLQLVRLLQQQMKLTATETVLQQGLALAPGSVKLRKIYAQLLLSSQRQEEAIELLKRAPLPGIVQDPDYFALLAALYQDLGRYEAAGSIYSQLLKIKPEAPLWWMGMAISLEQSGNPGQARNGYQKALSLPGLSPALQSFIESRLQNL